jgi:hypothetical protein
MLNRLAICTDLHGWGAIVVPHDDSYGARVTINADRLKRRLAVVAVLAVAVGCSGDGDEVVADDPSLEEATDDSGGPASAPSSSAPTTTTLPPGEFEAAATWEFELENSAGYRTAGTLTVGAVSRVDEAPPLPGLEDPTELELYCESFDPATDAVAPASLQLRNATQGFDIVLRNTFHLAATETEGALIRTADADLLHVAALYSDEVDCAPIVTADQAFFSEGDGWGVNWDEPAAPGETRQHEAMLILPGYYSPNTPDGDQARLPAIGLAIVPAMRGGGDNDATLVSLTGPDTAFGEAGGSLLFGSLAR